MVGEMMEKQERPTSTDFMEIGSSGLVQYGGRVEEDFLRQLQGKRGYAIYREMAENHPLIGAILHSIETLFRGVDWQAKPSDQDNQASIDQAEFLSECLNDMSSTWSDTVSGILGMLTYGFSFNEIVYKRRQGPQEDGTASKYVDGKIGWRKMPIRAHDTIERWHFDKNGGIEGVTQNYPLAGQGEV